MALQKEIASEIQNTGQERLGGKPTLSTAHAIAQSLAIGPVFSAVFVAALIAGAAGGVAPLAVLIASIGSLGIGFVITLYAKKFYGAGAIYEYLRLGANPAVGVGSAMIYFTGLAFLGAGAIYITLGLTASQLMQSLFGVTSSWWIWGIVFAALVFLLNHRGVKLASSVQLILSILSVIPLLILAITIIAKGGNAGNTWQAFNPTTSSSSAIFGGILFSILLFVGFETAASLGEETKNPQRSIPLAVMTVIIIATVFYLLIVYASDIGFGLNHADKWAADSAPLATLATRYVGQWLATLIDIAVILDMVAVATAFSSTVARGWFALARHKMLPEILTKQSKHGTPIGGNILTFILAVILSSVAPLTSVDGLTMFGIIATSGSVLIEIIYVVLGIYATRILIVEKAAWWKWILLILAVVTPLLGIYASVWPFPPYPQSISVYVAIAVIIISGVWVGSLSIRSKLSQASSRYDWDTQ